MSDEVNKSDDEWRAELSEEQYYICRQHGTEPPFTGFYWDCHEQGQYRCVCCNTVLFDSSTKFDSGSGWPSFWQAHQQSAIKLIEDQSHGMHRVEARCAQCDAHLGHLFEDGPAPSGQRYCINSASLVLDKD